MLKVIIYIIRTPLRYIMYIGIRSVDQSWDCINPSHYRLKHIKKTKIGSRMIECEDVELN